MTKKPEQPWWSTTNVHEKLMVKNFIKGLDSEPLATRRWEIKPLPQEFQNDPASVEGHREVNEKLSEEYFGVPQGYDVYRWAACPFWDGNWLHLKVYHKDDVDLEDGNKYGIVMGYWDDLRQIRRERTKVHGNYGDILIETGFNGTKCSICVPAYHHWPRPQKMNADLKKENLKARLGFQLIY